jgi:predicted nucleotidyltransferase
MTTGIDNALKQKIIGIVKVLVPKVKIYLYGSRARGTHNERSDIDIALDRGEKIPRIDVGEVRDMLNASNIIYKIDVVDLNSISPEMREVILKEGLLWKE